MTFGWPLLDAPSALVMIPLAAALVAFALPRAAAAAGLAAVLAGLAVAVALAARVVAAGPVRTTVGGWGAPLGIDLYADGLAALMLAMTALVGAGVSASAALAFGLGPRAGENRARAHRRRFFWPLWMLLLTGMNALFLSGDVFNLYVSMEIVGLSAVGLAVLGGGAAALRAGLVYLLASLTGSLLFLLGVDFLYAAFGRTDLSGLRGVATPGLAASAALSLMLAGLALKAALFPLHGWLPAAHANALPAASALLSALVVKTSLYVALRLGFDALAPVASGALPGLLGALGAGAIVWGSAQAFRATRLKLLVAHSTVAQIGYVALAFPLASTVGSAAAWSGVVYLMLAHAVAKAAMFLACARIADAHGHDEIAALGSAAARPSLARFAFALSAVSLVGLPPSGGFVGKWLLTGGAVAAGAWVWAGVALLGTALTTGYFLRVVAPFFRAPPPGTRPPPASWAWADGPPLLLALLAVALGLGASAPLELLAVGAPPSAGGGAP